MAPNPPASSIVYISSTEKETGGKKNVIQAISYNRADDLTHVVFKLLYCLLPLLRFYVGSIYPCSIINSNADKDIL